MKFYTEKQVATATLLATPLAGGILMAHNAKVIGHRKQKELCLGLSLAATALLLAIGYALPERVHTGPLFPGLAAFAMSFWYRKTQGDLITGDRFPNAERASWWLAMGISLAVVCGVFGLLYGILVLSAQPEDSPAPTSPAFTPNLANTKEVIVRGWTSQDLSRILADFKAMYQGDLGTDFAMEVHPMDGDRIRILFPHDMPGEQFSYFVNYLQYPKNFALNVRPITVVGKVVLTDDFHVPESSLINQTAYFYVPTDDKNYDRVYIRVGDRTYEHTFLASETRWKRVVLTRIPLGADIPK